MTTAKADLIFASLPYAILHTAPEAGLRQVREVDAEFYADLRRPASARFRGGRFGPVHEYLRRGSGYYIDIGASQA